MTKKLKLKISEAAYNKLFSILTEQDTYSCFRLKLPISCCNTSKLDILMDNPNNQDIVDSIEDIQFVYDNNLSETIKEITLIYKNDFMIKSIPYEVVKKDCSSCHKNCQSSEDNNMSNNDCSNCSGCKH